jgi:hypothetical protein
MPMMRFNLILATALAATLSAGCSTTGTQATDDDDKVYVTGSRISRNDRAAAGVTSTTDKNQINDMMRPAGATGGMVGTGGR